MIDYYKVKAISAHGIEVFLSSTPLEYKLYHDGRKEDKDTFSKNFGRITHSYLLENSIFNDNYTVVDEGIIIPEGKMGKLIEKVAIQNTFDINDIEKAREELDIKWKSDRIIKELEKKDNKRYFKIIQNTEGKSLVNYSDFMSIKEIHKNILNHKTAINIIDDPSLSEEQKLREVEVFWDNSLNQKCKAKIDILNIDPNKKIITVGEIKTTSKALKVFYIEVKRYAYYRQLAWYINEALPALMDQYKIDISDYKIQNRIIVCQTKHPYSVRVVELDDIDIIEGQKEYEYAIQEIKWHTDNDWWQKKEYQKMDEWVDRISVFNYKDMKEQINIIDEFDGESI